jgi:hypothetical protein
MLHRLPPTIERRRPMLNEIQADLHPLEVLFDVYKLMDEENVRHPLFHLLCYQRPVLGATSECFICQDYTGHGPV